MSSSANVLETGIDKLVNLVKERGRIPLADAAKELGVSREVVQEWVDFFDGHGTIEMEYSLMKPYIVQKPLSDKEFDVRANEIASKKEIVIRKAIVSLSFLQKQRHELEEIKKEFDRLKQELGLELDAVKGDLAELEEYQQRKEELKQDAQELQKESKAKIIELSKNILEDKQYYAKLISGVKRERKNLIKEKAMIKYAEKNVKAINKRLRWAKGMLVLVGKKVGEDSNAIKNSETVLAELSGAANNLLYNLNEEKSAKISILEKRLLHERKFLEHQKAMLKKMADTKKKCLHTKSMTKKAKCFIEKKLLIANLVDKVNKDREELEKSLIELVRKAKSFELRVNNGKVGKQLMELEKRFAELDKKKNTFGIDLKKLLSFLS